MERKKEIIWKVKIEKGESNSRSTREEVIDWWTFGVDREKREKAEQVRGNESAIRRI